MNIINLTDDYIKHIVEENDLNAYESSYPALFRHYFRYWAKRERFSKTLTKIEVKKRCQLVLSELKKIERKMVSAGFDTEALDIVLFVGQNTSNGHAFKDGRKFVVWIPLETYKTKLRCQIFILHEIIHWLHYSQSPDFYFQNATQKLSTARQLITEGIATYLTQRILKVDEGTVLWADYLSKRDLKKWLQECQNREKELCQFILKQFSSASPKIELFYANDPNDIYKYRAGYFVGWKLIEQMIKKKGFSDSELLKISRKRLENMIRELLRARAGI
jgi:uncharacterized protein YjaZ